MHPLISTIRLIASNWLRQTWYLDVVLLSAALHS